jgi:ribonucleoside-diphosphate reductase alpha chain
VFHTDQIVSSQKTAASDHCATGDFMQQLAARIAISNLHSKHNQKSFLETMTEMFEYVNPRNGQDAPLISEMYIK